MCHSQRFDAAAAQNPTREKKRRERRGPGVATTDWSTTIATRSKITRLFVYTFYGENKRARFDAGLVYPDGTPRPAFKVFAKNARKHR